MTLGRKDVVDRIVSAREPRKLPIVLSSEEVVRFLQAVPGLRSRAAASTPFRLDHRSREPSERIERSIREVERLCVKRGRREHGLLEERHEGDEDSG